jgi:hypothetical protein
MSITAESCVMPHQNLNSQIDIDQVLKKSREQALNDVKYLKEVDRINNFIKNVKNSKTSDIDFIDRVQSESVPFIDQLYDRSQILEDNMCQYSDSLRGITDNILSSVRIVDNGVNVSDLNGMVCVLKQGDLLIKYDSGCGDVGYLIKSGSRSNRYSEKYISNGENLNYKIICNENLALKTDWLFVADNFLSAIAIHHATGVKTVAIPLLNNVILNQLKAEYPDKRIMIFMGSKDVSGEVVPQGIYLTSTFHQGSSWAEYRDECLADADQKQGLATFTESLRQAMRSGM